MSTTTQMRGLPSSLISKTKQGSQSAKQASDDFFYRTTGAFPQRAGEPVVSLLGLHVLGIRLKVSLY